MEQFTANKKPLFDSDIDPKRIHKVADGLRRQGEFESARMLDAFADLLEAQERAMPVAVVKDSDALYTGWLSWTGEPAPPETKLYTHPAHSAQVQPPAVSVPGVSAQAHENAQAALAAQENPNG